MTNDPHNTQDTGPGKGRSSSLVEMVVGALGALVVLSALTFLAYEAVSVHDSAVQLSTSVTGVERVDGQYVVHFRVDNTGGTTAESVHVTGELTRGGEPVQTVTSVLAYVPEGSSRRGATVFTENPHDGDLTVWASSFRNP